MTSPGKLASDSSCACLGFKTWLSLAHMSDKDTVGEEEVVGSKPFSQVNKNSAHTNHHVIAKHCHRRAPSRPPTK
jgi:hypothetical protein